VRASIGTLEGSPVVNEPPMMLGGVVVGLADGGMVDGKPTRGSVGCGVAERGPLRGSVGGAVVGGPMRGSVGGAVVGGARRGSVGGEVAGGMVLVVGSPGTGGPCSTEGVRAGGGAVVGLPTCADTGPAASAITARTIMERVRLFIRHLFV
jgi:hypothetical protein